MAATGPIAHAVQSTSYDGGSVTVITDPGTTIIVNGDTTVGQRGNAGYAITSRTSELIGTDSQSKKHDIVSCLKLGDPFGVEARGLKKVLRELEVLGNCRDFGKTSRDRRQEPFASSPLTHWRRLRSCRRLGNARREMPTCCTRRSSRGLRLAAFVASIRKASARTD